MRVSSFFSLKLVMSCMNLKHTSIVWDYAEFTNLTIFGLKVVQLEIKTIVNTENNFWMVIRCYPWYINDCNSHFEYLLLSKHSKKQLNSLGPSPKLLFLERNKCGCIMGINL